MVTALCVLFLTLGTTSLGLFILDKTQWIWRRELQLFVLAAPIWSLLLSLLTAMGPGSHVWCGLSACASDGASWTQAVDELVVLGMSVIALGGLGLAVIRLALLTHVLARKSWAASQEVQNVSDHVADALGLRRPRVRIRMYNRPLALTYGFWRPAVLVSTWMLAHLDRGELEAVLAHELSHVARRDYHVLWLATLLRDAFFYVPTSRVAYRQLQDEKELACDDVAVAVTQRPLGLASALTKVWLHGLSGSPIGSSFALAPSLMGSRAQVQLVNRRIEARIRRLLDGHELGAGTPLPPVVRGVRIAPVLGLLLLAALTVGGLLTLMGCMATLPLHIA